MLYRKWFTVLSLFVIAALLLSACRPISASSAAPLAQNSAVPIPDMPRSDAPPYGLRGPHAVGVRDFVIEPAQEGERPINVTVWYPASNPDGRTEAETYMLNFNNPDYPDFAIAGRHCATLRPMPPASPIHSLFTATATGCFARLRPI